MKPLQAFCGCGMVDVHTHFVPASFPRYLGSRVDVPWPSTVEAPQCHRHVMVSGKVYRTVSSQCWDPPRRIADMAQMGVAAQVLSPMPELLSYWLHPEDGQQLCRYLNETAATLAQTHPAKFIGLGAVPLQDVDLAITELHAAIHDFGLAGVEIAGHVNGTPIGDPRFAPFFEAAAQWGASIFVHPLRAGMERVVGPPVLEQALAFPGEIGLAGASLITGGTLGRFPALRLALSHGGGSLPILLARLQHAWTRFPALREKIATSPAIAARQLYVDDLVYDPGAMRQLVSHFGEDRVMVGTDYPFQIMDDEPHQRLQACAFSDDVLKLLLRDNARRWLGGVTLAMPDTSNASIHPRPTGPR